jgi:hypothetical protein
LSLSFGSESSSLITCPWLTVLLHRCRTVQAGGSEVRCRV